MSKTRLLLAEKDASLRETFQSALQSRGYEVKSAGDETECLKQLGTRWPDVLVLDCVLPHVADERRSWTAESSGWSDGANTIVNRLRHDRLLLRIPVVLLAGVGTAESLARLVVAPVTAYLQKPFRFSRLLDELLKAVATPVPASLERAKPLASSPVRHGGVALSDGRFWRQRRGSPLVAARALVESTMPQPAFP